MNKSSYFVAAAVLSATGWYLYHPQSESPNAPVLILSDEAKMALAPLTEPQPDPSVDAIVQVGLLKTSQERVTALGPLLAGFSNGQYSKVLKAISAARGKDRRLFNEVFDFWCKSDPEGAVHWAAQEMPVGREGRMLREKAGFAWAARDFDAAYTWMLTPPDIKDNWSLATLTLGKLAVTDPVRALSHVPDVQHRRFRLAATSRILEGWAGVDPRAALNHMAPIMGDRPDYIKGVQAWIASDPKPALDGLLSEGVKSESDVQLMFPRMIGEASRKHRQEVADILHASAAYQNTDYFILEGFKKVMCEWAKEAPADVSLWLKAIEDPQDRQKIANALVSVSEPTNGDGTWKIPFASVLADPSQKETALVIIAKEWASSDPGAAFAWSEKLAVPAVSEAALSSAVVSIARTDHERAKKLIPRIQSVEQRRQAISEVINGWAETEPSAACEWALQMADGSSQIEQSLIYSVQTWVAGDGAAAIRWMNQKNVSPTIIRGGTEHLIKDYPVDDAARILAAIENSDERNYALVKNVERWLRINRRGAEKWLEQSTLGADEKARLLRN